VSTLKTSSSRKGILAGGNFIADRVKQIDLYPEQDRLALIQAESLGTGGGAYNILKNIAMMDPTIPLEGIGLVGNDALGDWIVQDCSDSSIDIRQLRRTSDAPTSYTDVMSVVSTGRRTFFHQSGANSLLDVPDFDFSQSEARMFYLGYPCLLERLDQLDGDGLTGAARVLAQARSDGMTTAADLVSGQHAHFREIVVAAAPELDYLLLNEIEAGWIVDRTLCNGEGVALDDATSAAAEILELGVSNTVVIHFEAGAVARSSQGEVSSVRSLKLTADEIQGAAGAGDAFGAGFLHGVHEGIPIEAALHQGVCCAAACLSHPSCTGGMKPLAECLRTRA
jgi:sugar/nucleoside kinase (ribokinase family)